MIENNHNGLNPDEQEFLDKISHILTVERERKAIKLAVRKKIHETKSSIGSLSTNGIPGWMLWSISMILVFSVLGLYFVLFNNSITDNSLSEGNTIEHKTNSPATDTLKLFMVKSDSNSIGKDTLLQKQSVDNKKETKKSKKKLRHKYPLTGLPPKQ